MSPDGSQIPVSWIWMPCGPGSRPEPEPSEVLCKVIVTPFGDETTVALPIMSPFTDVRSSVSGSPTTGVAAGVESCAATAPPPIANDAVSTPVAMRVRMPKGNPQMLACVIQMCRGW